ncbi:hypothetical protein QKV95_gp080 [Poseidoniales virus YSH_150918]|uniref:Uncharacterized protein n=1 Tax=Poseidoniales virus YSH_150918 TaxID=3071324 RepID=A0A976UBJ5_9CAUD|nr:hypothetical protein QKV95_gp080 [Yangshan Harbor Poseidoniales virus]UVF62557.1 hypothetical protein [Poseidoniales virus YSH_150918]
MVSKAEKGRIAAERLKKTKAQQKADEKKKDKGATKETPKSE